LLFFSILSTYSYCGQVTLSNIHIPELPQSKNVKAGFLFRLDSAQPLLKAPVWLHHWLSPGGEILLSYCKQGSYHWLHFPDLADFHIAANAKEISCYSLSGVPQETIRHLLLDQVLPRCLAHQGKIMVHASAVQLEQGLLLFIGDSGTGKSTLAGDFHQMGQPVVSDDCLWVKENKERIWAVPTYGGLRLWEDSLEALFPSEQDTLPMAHYSSKKRVPLAGQDFPEFGEGYPVLAVIILAPPDQVSHREIILERLSRRETFITLLKQTFQLDVTDLDRMTRHVQKLERIIPRLPTFRLTIPRDYALLPLVRQKILETVQSLR
jgi:hypothetical protein